MLGQSLCYLRDPQLRHAIIPSYGGLGIYVSQDKSFMKHDDRFGVVDDDDDDEYWLLMVNHSG